MTSAFIVQIIPELQPDPADLTNVLLLRLLQQNTSFDGVDPLAPVSSVPANAVRAQSILFASLSVTLLVAFIAVLGKQWILYYTRVTTWGNIVDRGRERQEKLAGLQKWGLQLIMESLPVMLQFALLLFGVALATYLWDLNVSIAEVVMTVTSFGLVFYVCITVTATMYKDCPFQTPLSILLPEVLPRAKGFTAPVRGWLRRKAASLPIRIEHACKIFASEKNIPDYTEEDIPTNDYLMRLSNPAFWRNEPLFTSPVPEDTGASAGFWLLENSTDISAASAVAAVFSEIQWPSHYRSTTALKRLKDMYVECFRAPEFKESSRLKALQCAAAYYVLYHTQMIWNASNELATVVEGFPPDLLLDLHSEKWGGDDVFEHLLRTKDRSDPVTSARFLAYVAPYWFCGDSDSAVRFRPSRLQTLHKLIEVLEENRALDPVTLTDCVLCVGAAVDFPLHPDDLVRVDKRCVLLPCALTVILIGDSEYFGQAFKMVVEHIHRQILDRGRRRRHAKTALDILHTIVKKATLPLVDPTWIKELLDSAARGNMDDDTFTLFLRLSARRKEEDSTADVGTPHGQDHIDVRGGELGPQPPGETTPLAETSTPAHILFIKILQNVQTCSMQEAGWQDEAVYGGLIAMGDIPRLGSFLPDSDSLETLSNAMEKCQPFRVRKAAYDVVLAARDGWLRSAGLYQALEDLDFPRQLCNVVIDTGRADYQRSFLEMMEILLMDEHWHPYLRGAMDILLPFRHEVPWRVLRIVAQIGKLPLSGYDGTNPSHLDKYLEKLVEDEWKGVPGRSVVDLTADRLEPLAEVTTQLKALLFTETDRRAVLAAVERVIPALERRRDNGYEDACRVVDDLLEVLRVPVQSDQPSVHSSVD